MTVALVLAGRPDEADAGRQRQLRGQLAALGVHRVDAAEGTGPGLLTVAAAARAAGERILICAGADTVPEPVLARLLGAGGTAAFTGVTARSLPEPQVPVGQAPGALVVDIPDLDALAVAAEALAATDIGSAAVGALTGELTRRGIAVRILDAGPDSEGAVTQLAADPAARDLAAWAAMRQLTPAALYGISLGLGLIAATWFAELAVRSKLLAVAALAGSFLFARAGSLSAATSAGGRIRAVTGWLGTACGLLTELGIYAALAVSAGLKAPGSRPGPGWRAWTAPSAARCGTPSRAAGAAPARPACGGWPSRPRCCSASGSWPAWVTSTPPGPPAACSPARCCAWARRASPCPPASGWR